MQLLKRQCVLIKEFLCSNRLVLVQVFAGLAFSVYMQMCCTNSSGQPEKYAYGLTQSVNCYRYARPLAAMVMGGKTEPVPSVS